VTTWDTVAQITAVDRYDPSRQVRVAGFDDHLSLQPTSRNCPAERADPHQALLRQNLTRLQKTTNAPTAHKCAPGNGGGHA